jgi:hypothetical protein
MTPESQNNGTKKTCLMCGNGHVNMFSKGSDMHATIEELGETVFLCNLCRGYIVRGWVRRV